MPRLLLRWSSSLSDVGPPPADDDVVLVFAPSAAPPAGAGRVLLADGLLDWSARAYIENRVQDLLTRLRDGLGDPQLLESAEYELRIEWVNVLCAHAAASALRDEGPFDELLPSSGTPAAIVAGVSSALAVTAASAPDWRLELHFRGGIGLRGQAARAIIAARAATSARRHIRVLTVPGQRLGLALARLSREQAGGLGLAVAALPELGHGEAAKLVLSHRLPALALPTSVPAPTAAMPGADIELPAQLSGDPALDRALLAIAQAVLAYGAQRVAAVTSLRPALEALPRLRAVVLPTCALGVTRLVRGWASERGIRVASFQHGIYGLIEGDGGDRRADVLFGWAPEVANQVRQWAPPRPRVVPVGVPDLPHAPARFHTGPPRRVLVATTNAPVGTALARWGEREQYLDALAGGLDRLCAAGVDVELRLHPAESPAEYEAMDRAAGRGSLAFAPPGPFAEAATRADLLVSPYSSVAFEAAALGLPVALWVPRIPEAVRRAHLLAPLSEELPGSFSDAAGFEALAGRILGAAPDGRESLVGLSHRLAAYVAPFDAGRFAAELGELGE
jgi:hypothetical protein